MPTGPQAALIVLAIVIPVVALAIFLVERRHGKDRRRGEEAPRLPLFGTDQLQMRRHGDQRAAASDAPPARPRRPIRRTDQEAERSTAAPSAPAPSATSPTPPRPAPLVTPPPSAPITAEYPARAGIANDDVTDSRLIEGETLRFVIPSDGTVEFLPGRLEVVAGPEAGREIRFARAPGEGDVEVTFGRSEGPANRHIQILARTVSRRHAVMSLIEDHWQLTNLSATNPLVLNGRVFGSDEMAPLLVEGDRIEMGEVAFVFHDR